MLTDAPPRKARAGFLESDHIKMLDLSHDGRLPWISQQIESAMKVGKGAAVQHACTEFLQVASSYRQVQRG